jgi:hypothetical protein
VLIITEKSDKTKPLAGLLAKQFGVKLHWLQ